MSDRIYPDFGARFIMSLGGAVSVVGTTAAAIGLTPTQRRLPFRCKVVGASIVQTVGGTSAGPALVLAYSTGGTGTWTAIGTFACGTNANLTSGDFSVTATELAAGDNLRVTNPAGTLASTRTANFSVALEELFN